MAGWLSYGDQSLRLGRIKQVMGVLAVLVGAALGLFVMRAYDIPPVVAAILTTIDVMIGITLFWMGTRQRRRAKAQRF
jgi:Flp pilus assembly protein TadB